MAVLKVNPEVAKQERKMKRYGIKMLTGYAAQIEFSADFTAADIGTVQSTYRSNNTAHSFAKVRAGVYMITLKKNVKSKVSRNRWFEIVKDSLRLIVDTAFVPATPKKKKVKKPNEKQAVASELKQAAESGLAKLETETAAVSPAPVVNNEPQGRVIGVKEAPTYFFTVWAEETGITLAIFKLLHQPFQVGNSIRIPGNDARYVIRDLWFGFENGHITVRMIVA